jgi:hypothetical protein
MVHLEENEKYTGSCNRRSQNTTKTTAKPRTHLCKLVEARVAHPGGLRGVGRQGGLERLLAAAAVAEDQPAVVAVVPPAGECECVLAVVALGVVLARGPLVGADGGRETGAACNGNYL